MEWIYKNQLMESISDFPDNTHGFVYKIKHIPTGKVYIGRKILQNTTKVKLGKKELKEPDEFFNDNILGKFFTKDFD